MYFKILKFVYNRTSILFKIKQFIDKANEIKYYLLNNNVLCTLCFLYIVNKNQIQSKNKHILKIRQMSMFKYLKKFNFYQKCYALLYITKLL